MPNVQRLDKSDGHTGRSEAEAGVRESAPLLDARVRHRPDWPFLYSCEGGRTYVNRAPRKSAYKIAQESGDALM